LEFNEEFAVDYGALCTRDFEYWAREVYFVAGLIVPRHKSSALLQEVVDQQNPRVLLADSPIRADDSRKCFGISTPSTIVYSTHLPTHFNSGIMTNLQSQL
jgi:hypothetical protein